VEIVIRRIDTGITDSSHAREAAQILDQCGETELAVVFLNKYSSTRSNPALMHQLATYSAAIGDGERARHWFQCLVESWPENRQFVVEAAQTFWLTGDRKRAVSLCECAVDQPRQSIPTPDWDCYWDGFLNWICGRFERAEYDFVRAGVQREFHYQTVFPDAKRDRRLSWKRLTAVYANP